MVLQGASFSRSGPKAFRKTGALLTFWEKWKAGQAHERTHLVFAGSCRGPHFTGQAPKPIAAKMPKGLFGESGRQVQHMRGHIQFLLGPAGGAVFQLRPRSPSQQRRPRDFLGRVERRSNTRGAISSFCLVLQGAAFFRAGPKAFRKKGALLTFWEKWKTGQAHEGTYLVFAGS